MPAAGCRDNRCEFENGHVGDRSLFWLLFFCSLWFVVWSLLPALFLGNPYIDILENLVWGRHLQFGYDKNPYFGAWITRFGYVISGHEIWSAYVLSQVSVLVCFLCVWKLARKIFSPVDALISVLLLVGIRFYGPGSLEFNDDVIEISLWALSVLFFQHALLNQKTTSWALVGLFTGLAFMTKYYAVALFVPMAVVVFVTAEGRSAFRRPGIYLAVLIFIILTLPNLVWLHANRFVAFNYAFRRAHVTAETVSRIIPHLDMPLRYLTRMAGIVMTPLAVFWLCFWKRKKQVSTFSPFHWKFFSILCCGPLVCTFFFSVLTGAHIKGSWNTPILNLLGVFLIMLRQPEAGRRQLRLFGYLTGFLLIFWIGYFSWQSLVRPYYSIKGSAVYVSFPGREVGESLTELWHKTYHRKLKYVVANRKLACNVAVFSPDKPEAYFSANPYFSQWINEADLYPNGALLLWEGAQPGWLKRFEAHHNAVIFNPPRTYRWAIKKWLKPFVKDRPLSAVIIQSAFIEPEDVAGK